MKEGCFDESFKEALNTCLMCLACEDVCPQEVKVTEEIETAKNRIWYERKSTWTSKLLNATVSPLNPAKFANANTHSSSYKICAIFVGCVIPFKYPYLLEETVRFLKEMGYNPFIPEDQACCGHPEKAVGNFEKNRKFIEKNTEIFKQYPVVITPCSTCSYHLKKQYPTLKVKDIIELVIEYAEIISPKENFQNQRISFHHPCHLHRGQGIKREIDKALTKIFGENFIPVENFECCGFGGEVSILYPDISNKVGIKRVREFIAKDIEVILTSCPACMMQLEKIAFVNRIPIKVKHLIETIEF